MKILNSIHTALKMLDLVKIYNQSEKYDIED